MISRHPSRWFPLFALLALYCSSSAVLAQDNRPALLLPLGHTNALTSVAASANGKCTLTGSLDKTAIFWDADSGKPLHIFRGHGQPINAVALSADGKRALTGSWDHTAILWDTVTGKQLRVLKGHTGQVQGVALSPDGKRAVTGSWDNNTILWDAETGQQIRTFRGQPGQVYSVALAASGQRILAGTTAGANLWDVATGNLLQTFKGHKGTITAVALDHHGKRVLTGSHDKLAIFWDADTGQPLRQLVGHTDGVYAMALSPDGERALTGADYQDGSALLWDTGTGKVVQAFRRTRSKVAGVALTADGQRVLTGSWDETAVLWNAHTAQPVQTFQRLAELTGSVALDGAGTRLVTNTRTKKVVLWDLAACRPLRTFTGDMRSDQSVALSQDGKRLLTGSRTAVLWDADTGALVRAFLGHTVAIWSAAMSGDGKRILSGASDKTAILWDAETGKRLQTLQGKDLDFSSVALSQDGKRILTSHSAPHATLWDADTGQPLHVLKGHTSFIGQVTFSGDARRALTTSGDKSAILWDTQTGKALQTLWPLRYPEPFKHLEDNVTYVHSLALSHDGKLVLTAAFTPIAILWDAEKAQPVQIFHDHHAFVSGAAFGPAESFIVTSSADGAVRIWKRGRTEPVFSFLSVGEEWVFWTPEGYYTCSPNGESLIAWKVGDDSPHGYRVVAPEQLRKQFYRPELFPHLFKELNLNQALAAANRETNRPNVVVAPTIAQVLPPVVVLTRPDRDGEIDAEALTIEAVAVSVGTQAVTRLRLLVDGRPYQGNLSTWTIPEPKLGKAKRSWQAELEPGEHTVQVIAENAAGTEGRSDLVRVRRKAIVETLPRLFVLAVGISNYEKENLRKGVYYSAADARKFADTIEQASKPLYREIKVIRLLDRDATRQKILQALTHIRKQATQRDAVLIFFAGHGKRDEQNNFYFLPMEVDVDDLASTGLSEGDFKVAVKALPGRVILLLDACHSGTLIENNRRSGEGLTDRLYRDLTSNEYGLVLMCSSRGAQVSRESNQLQGGLFTVALVEGLQGKARKLEGAVYLRALDDYVTERVRQLSEGGQHPLTSRASSISDIPLTRP